MKKSLFLILFVLLMPCMVPGTHAQVINTIAGNGSYGYSGDGGAATLARVEYIWHIARDASGNVYFTDNATRRVRKIDLSGTISTIAGDGISGSTGDGGPATAARFMGPSGITIDVAGNIYVADNVDNRIRMINTAGMISTYAGVGLPGATGDGGPATSAALNAPYGIVIDAAGNLYIGDASNNKVRKVDAAGMISTVAGNGTAGFSGDGTAATEAKLSSPASVAIDNWGNLYIGDANNNRIRMVNSTGVIATVAGTGTAAFGGDGGAATAAFLNKPLGIAVDGLGNLVISDQFNNRLRKVSPAGIISTIAGTGTAAFGGDGGPAIAADINQPFGVILDDTGNIYVSDWGNYRLRKIGQGNRIPAFASGAVDSIAICENSGAASINSLLIISDADTAQTETWSLLTPPVNGTAMVAYTATAVAGSITPSGLTYTPTTGFAGMDSFKVMVEDGYSLDTMNIYIRVKPLPDPGIISGSSLVCIGIPVPYTETEAGGVWSSSSALATISSTGLVNGVSYGRDTIYYTVTLEGCADFTSKEIDIYTIVDSVSGPGSVCFGLSVLLEGIPPGGVWSSTNGNAAVSGGLVSGITPGVDTIVYTVTNPCSVSTFLKPIAVNALVAPVVEITATPSAFIVPGTSDTLTAVITSGGVVVYSYQWQLNGVDIPGATTNTYISDTFHNGDSVTCFVLNGACSAASFNWIYIVYISDGVNDHDLAKMEIGIVPNPNAGVFTLNGALGIGTDEVVIEVSDLVGRVIYHDDVHVVNGVLKKEMTIGNDLASGMYLLHVITNGGQKVLKFSVSR